MGRLPQGRSMLAEITDSKRLAARLHDVAVGLSIGIGFARRFRAGKRRAQVESGPTSNSRDRLGRFEAANGGAGRARRGVGRLG